MREHYDQATAHCAYHLVGRLSNDHRIVGYPRTLGKRLGDATANVASNGDHGAFDGPMGDASGYIKICIIHKSENSQQKSFQIALLSG